MCPHLSYAHHTPLIIRLLNLHVHVAVRTPHSDQARFLRRMIALRNGRFIEKIEWNTGKLLIPSRFGRNSAAIAKRGLSVS